MNESPQHLHEFLETRPWAAYPAARVSFVAYRSDARVFNLAASVVFEAQPAADQDAVLNVEVGPFVIHEARYSQAVIEPALRGLDQSEAGLRLPQLRLLLTPTKANGAGWSRPAADTSWPHTIGWPNSIMQWLGAKVGEVAPEQEFWAALPQLPGASPRSFADWNQVGELVSPSQRLARQRGHIAIGPGLRTRFDVHIPTYVRLHSGRFDVPSGMLTLHVDARHLQGEVTAVVRAMADRNEILRFESTDFSVNTDCGHLCASAPLPPEAGPVMCDLLVRGELHERQPVGVPPSPVRLYSALEPGNGWLDRLQKKAGKGASDSFEQWVHALFSLAGISMIHFGHGQQTFPDLTGWVLPNAAIAVEVTLQAPDLNKLVELQRRVLSMRQALSASVPSGVVFPAMFFNQAGAQVPRDVGSSAQQEGIALVSLERLTTFRDDVLSGAVQGVGVIKTLMNWGARG